MGTIVMETVTILNQIFGVKIDNNIAVEWLKGLFYLKTNDGDKRQLNKGNLNFGPGQSKYNPSYSIVFDNLEGSSSLFFF